MTEECIFCKIANGSITTDILYQTAKVAVFRDIDPKAPTHLLVVPKEHVESLNQLEDKELMCELLSAVREVTKKLGIKTYRTVINTGKDAGQSVFHLHLHILAGRDFTWPPG